MKCNRTCEPTNRLALSIFHGHDTALMTARFFNRTANRKVKRVKVIDRHYHVVDV